MSDAKNRAFRLETFRAVLDRIIPADDYPGALDNGVDGFILSLWDAGLVADPQAINRGLMDLDAQTSGGFARLLPEEQDRLLAECKDEAWFHMLCELAAEGFYADPANGANPDAVSWGMIGYRPGLPEGPSGPSENPQDVVRGRLWA
ncbi:gluconate 2-dehydrogenase subunit 3 family protein [Agrobacterium rhizogenes]|nr:gluconate 2-dehydrogenase subunit 3 family protein [Rhizobium rhizogenes]NTJ82548.1 gluconate 2-dehydrogenase subunit 3 family protein [Rhizobium rhizogenes]